jgi:UDP-N-acetylmuramate dehydrogenase
VIELSAHSTIGLGGPAQEFHQVENERDLMQALLGVGATRPFLLGQGSNVLIADRGVEGLTIKVASKGIERRRENGSVVLRVQAGESWDLLVAECISEGLAGVECLRGIPGTVGAAPIQNIGAYGQELGETLVGVRVVEMSSGELVALSREECGFAYRNSRFKRERARFAIISIDLELARTQLSMPIHYSELAETLGINHGSHASLAEVGEAVLSLRSHKGMVLDSDDPDSRSLGSFFMNPVIDEEAMHQVGISPPIFGRDVPVKEVGEGRFRVPAAWLIAEAGFEKGHGNPDRIAISTKHLLALTNRGAGSSAEAIELAAEIAGRVDDMFGVHLVPEPDLIGHRALPRGWR